MKEILKYGDTILPELYWKGIQAHAYIPQSDQYIRSQIKDTTVTLDLGCGPGRLYGGWSNYTGIDESREFVDYAKKTFPKANFILGAFEDINIEPSRFDVVFSQGVLHHVHGDTRKLWFKKIFDILKPNGKLIVGDEYIPNFRNEAERKIKLVVFYSHIIAEALNGSFEFLATEEARNLIDDVTAGGEGAGFADNELIKYIYQASQRVNSALFEDFDLEKANSIGKETVDYLIQRSAQLEESAEHDNFYRGDYKVSISDNIKEIETFGLRHTDTATFGPVSKVGGMGVIVFTKK